MANILSLCLSKRGEHFAPRPKFGNDKINIRLMFMANTETTNTAPIFYLQTKTETIYGLWAIMGLFRGCNWLKADQVQYGLECLFGWKVQKIQVRKNLVNKASVFKTGANLGNLKLPIVTPSLNFSQLQLLLVFNQCRLILVEALQIANYDVLLTTQLSMG